MYLWCWLFFRCFGCCISGSFSLLIFLSLIVASFSSICDGLGVILHHFADYFGDCSVDRSPVVQDSVIRDSSSDGINGFDVVWSPWVVIWIVIEEWWDRCVVVWMLGDWRVVIWVPHAVKSIIHAQNCNYLFVRVLGSRLLHGLNNMVELLSLIHNTLQSFVGGGVGLRQRFGGILDTHEGSAQLANLDRGRNLDQCDDCTNNFHFLSKLG